MTYGTSPALDALQAVRQLNGLKTLALDPARITYAFIEAAGIPVAWLKRPPNRNHILLGLYER